LCGRAPDDRRDEHDPVPEATRRDHSGRLSENSVPRFSRRCLASLPPPLQRVRPAPDFSRTICCGAPRAADGTCVDTGYPGDWDEVLCGKRLHFRRACEAVGANLVLLVVVLEHVDAESELLAKYAAKVVSRARFLVTVPAFQWLWSEDFRWFASPASPDHQKLMSRWSVARH
jgi:hypothetical protein